VFPARYELNSYIVFRKRLVSKRLKERKERLSEGCIGYCSTEDSLFSPVNNSVLVQEMYSSGNM
jgi:hypothetical protein